MNVFVDFRAQSAHPDWYEAGLPSQERKRRGHFSTPPLLVEQIFDACGYRPECDLSAIRVLDPACGSGNFLVGAARRLLAFTARAGFSRGERNLLVQRNLWGVDPDPVACFLAEMQLRALMIERDVVSARTPQQLHIHQADGLTFPWEPCVDLLVANPPYLAVKNNDLSGYQLGRGNGQADSYLLFLDLAFQAVRPGGWIGLVLPDPVLARANAALVRERLLKEYTLHHLWHLAGVFAAHVGAVVLVARKAPPPPRHHVTWRRERWERSDAVALSVSAPSRPSEGTISQEVFARQPRSEFRYLLSEGRGALFEQLRQHIHIVRDTASGLATLGEFVTIRRGEELGRSSPQLLESSDGAPQLEPGEACRWYPVLRGGVDVHPYQKPLSRWWIAREAVTKPLTRYLAPKLLVVKSTGRLQATLDIQGHIALQTLYLLHLRANVGDGDDLYFFLALLNSRLLREYVATLYTSYKWVQPQIEQHVLAALPVPLTHGGQRIEIIERAKAMLRACGSGASVVEWSQEILTMYEEQERAISALYTAALPQLFG